MAYVPLSILPLALYFVGALFVSGGAGVSAFWQTPIVTASLVSGVSWPFTFGDALVTLALVMLLVGTLRAAGTRDAGVAGSLVAILALGVHVVLFLVVPAAGTSLFFTLTTIALAGAITRVALSMALSPHRGHSETLSQ